MNKNNSHEEPNKIRQLQLFPIEFGVKWGWFDIRGAIASQVLKSYYNGLREMR